MKGILKVALGVVTGIGGFLDAGTIATCAQAGALFQFRLLWVVALGTLCIIFLSEMLGRLACVSHHTLAAAIRERFGIRYHAIPLVAELFLDIIVLAAEIGGVAMALKLLTGIGFPWWSVPVAAAVWLLLWRGTFDVVENGVALLGLVTVCFAVAAYQTHPPLRGMLAGLVPSLPPQKPAQYWFIAVSLMGSLLCPYVLNFYSAGAVEEGWTAEDLGANRVAATLGMSFGGTLGAALLIGAAMVLYPKGIDGNSYQEMQLVTSIPLGHTGATLFAVSLGVTCFGAALQVALNLSYTLAQAFGWNWSENLKPADNGRFAAVYTVAIFLAAIVVAVGFDPLKVTMLAMAFNAVVAPLLVLPLLILMNDEDYLGPHTNGWFANLVVSFSTVLAFVMGIVAIPLQFFGGT
jgi:Mn2+/Fe2+ NRAMP family transporter